MKNRKVGSIIIFLAMVIILVIFWVIKFGIPEKEPSTLKGEIVSVNGIDIVCKRENGTKFRVVKSEVPKVVDKDGNRKDIQKLQVGQQIIVKFKGSVQESNPAGVKGVVEIIVE